MPQHDVLLVWYVLRTDKNEYEISTSQMKSIVEADKQGRRFVNIGEAVINLAFIREMEKKKSVRSQDDIDEFPLSEQDKKFIVESKKDDTLSISS